MSASRLSSSNSWGWAALASIRRVLRGGEVGPGDHVQLIPGPTDAPSIRELFELWYDTAPDLAKLERYLEFPLAVRVRARVQRQLTDAHGVPGP